MAEIHSIRCMIENAELRALQYEARDSIRPEDASRAPLVPRNDGQRLRTDQWSEDLQTELHIRGPPNRVGANTRRKNARFVGDSSSTKTRTDLYIFKRTQTRDETGVSLHDSYLREAQLRVRNCLRQTSMPELPKAVLESAGGGLQNSIGAAGAVFKAAPCLKNVHESTLTNWVKDLHTEFTWAPKNKPMTEDVEEIEELPPPRVNRGRKPRSKRTKIKPRYASDKVLLGIPHQKDVELHSDFHGPNSFARFQMASTAKAKQELGLVLIEEPKATSRTAYQCDMCGQIHEVSHCQRYDL